MSEFEDKLNSILSDPGMMSQIMGLARSLGGNEASPAQSSEPSQPTQESSSPEFSNPLSFFSSLDPRLLDTAVKIMNAYQSNDDRRAALLTALRPFVREERYSKLDQAIRITKLTQAIRIALDTFRTREGGNGLV